MPRRRARISFDAHRGRPTTEPVRASLRYAPTRRSGDTQPKAGQSSLARRLNSGPDRGARARFVQGVRFCNRVPSVFTYPMAGSELVYGCSH
jgi:hypothetical protein